MTMAIVDPPTSVAAEFFVRRMTAGKTGALLLVARTAEGDPVECVVKLDSQLTMPPAEHLREWIAAALARRLGIATPRPYRVHVARDFAAAIDDPAVRSLALRQTGPAFGSALATGGFTAPTLGVPLSVDVRSAAADLVAFDVFIHNPDRRRDTPNVLVGRREVVAIDHGEAFAFLLPILGAPDASTDPLLDLAAKHVFGTAFGPRSAISLDRLRDAVAGLDDPFFDALRVATPAAWTAGPATGNLEQMISVLRRRRDAVDRWLPQVEAWLLR